MYTITCPGIKGLQYNNREARQKVYIRMLTKNSFAQLHSTRLEELVYGFCALKMESRLFHVALLWRSAENPTSIQGVLLNMITNREKYLVPKSGRVKYSSVVPCSGNTSTVTALSSGLGITHLSWSLVAVLSHWKLDIDKPQWSFYAEAATGNAIVFAKEVNADYHCPIKSGLHKGLDSMVCWQVKRNSKSKINHSELDRFSAAENRLW